MTHGPYEAELPSGTQLVRGRYTIERSLAFGGAATVYVARTPNGQSVALKVLDANSTHRDRHAARMRNEVKIGAGLHEVPNLVRPLDHGELPELGGRPFIAFELEDARDLDTLLIYGRLTPLRACEIARALADTLAHLHARGVVHRDVKPANIIVDDQHDALRVRLLDLGHASSIGYGSLPDTRGLTQERELTGTVEYMAPEHILGYPAEPSFDVYGLAATLWEMVLGLNPYSGRQSLEVMRLKCDPAAESPTLDRRPLAFGLDPDLKALIERGLKKDVRERIASAADFRRELDRIIARLRGGEVVPFPKERRLAEVAPEPCGATEAATQPPEAAEDLATTAEPRIEPAPSSTGIAREREPEPSGEDAQLEKHTDRATPTPWGRRTLVLVGCVASVTLAVVIGMGLTKEDAPGEATPVRAAAIEGRSNAELRTPADDARRPRALSADAVSPPDTDREEPTPEPSKLDSPPAAAEAPLRSGGGGSGGGGGGEKGSESPGKSTAPRKRPPKTPTTTDAQCSQIRADVKQAKARGDWAAVLSLTDRHRSCWRTDDRLHLRLRALRTLGRYADCIEEGQRNSDFEVQRQVAGCRASQG